MTFKIVFNKYFNKYLVFQIWNCFLLVRKPMSKAARRKSQNCQLNIMNEKTFTTVTRANIFPSGSSLSSPNSPLPFPSLLRCTRRHYGRNDSCSSWNDSPGILHPPLKKKKKRQARYRIRSVKGDKGVSQRWQRVIY